MTEPCKDILLWIYQECILSSSGEMVTVLHVAVLHWCQCILLHVLNSVWCKLSVYPVGSHEPWVFSQEGEDSILLVLMRLWSPVAVVNKTAKVKFTCKLSSCRMTEYLNTHFGCVGCSLETMPHWKVFSTAGLILNSFWRQQGALRRALTIKLALKVCIFYDNRILQSRWYCFPWLLLMYASK
jgi:hypothetical protein